LTIDTGGLRGALDAKANVGTIPDVSGFINEATNMAGSDLITLTKTGQSLSIAYQPLVTELDNKLNTTNFATKLTTQADNQTFVGPLLSNFTLCGGGTVTVKNVSGQVYIKWSERAICIPMYGTTGGYRYYDIVCPTSGNVRIYTPANTIDTTTNNVSATDGIP
jgi:hypothetical protein